MKQNKLIKIFKFWKKRKMTQNDLITMLKDALDEANDSRASLSDFKNTAKVLACVDLLTKSNFFSRTTVFSAVESELIEFLDSSDFVENMKGELPSVKRVLLEFRLKYIPDGLQELDVDLTQQKVDFGNIS